MSSLLTPRRILAALLVLAAIYAASPRTVFCGSIYGGPVFGATWGSGKPPFTVVLIHNRYHTAVGCYLTNSRRCNSSGSCDYAIGTDGRSITFQRPDGKCSVAVSVLVRWKD